MLWIVSLSYYTTRLKVLFKVCRVAIWVDADACPKVVKDILVRNATRSGISLTFVANQYVSVPNLDNIKSVQVSSGFDVADDEIVKRVKPGDLVITSDLPLADEVIEKQAKVLTPRGETLTTDNIKSRLNMRDFLEVMRSSGVQSGGPAKFSQSDKQEFANKLDCYLVQWARLQK